MKKVHELNLSNCVEMYQLLPQNCDRRLKQFFDARLYHLSNIGVLCFLEGKIYGRRNYKNSNNTTGPGCSGTRNLSDNISDLRAAVAANQKGTLFKSCSSIHGTHYGIFCVFGFWNSTFSFVRETLNEVRELLKRAAERCPREKFTEEGEAVLDADDFMVCEMFLIVESKSCSVG